MPMEHEEKKPLAKGDSPPPPPQAPRLHPDDCKDPSPEIFSLVPSSELNKPAYPILPPPAEPVVPVVRFSRMRISKGEGSAPSQDNGAALEEQDTVLAAARRPGQRLKTLSPPKNTPA